MNWYYQGKEIAEHDIPEGAVGFIYKITRSILDENIVIHEPSGLELREIHSKIYIGKKQLLNATKKKVGKREAAKQLLETGDKRKVKKIIRGTKTSNWLGYNSSCNLLIQEIKETPELFRKEIICWCFSKKELGYRELEQQFLYKVLETDSYNDNIGGTYYRKDLIHDNRSKGEEGIT